VWGLYREVFVWDSKQGILCGGYTEKCLYGILNREFSVGFIQEGVCVGLYTVQISLEHYKVKVLVCNLKQGFLMWNSNRKA
jgi:hypothetical protein